MIACYKQNIHLLPFADVFLKSLFVVAGGGEIAQLVITGGRLLNWSECSNNQLEEIDKKLTKKHFLSSEISLALHPNNNSCPLFERNAKLHSPEKWWRSSRNM